MKKFFVSVAVVMVFAVALFAVVANAQTGEVNLYTVQEGDNLYTLEGNYSGRPSQWARLMDLNPFLKNPGRIWTDNEGRTIVLIRPGEQLRGLVELGIIPKLYPLDQLKVVAPPVPATAPTTAEAGIPWWVWLLVALGVFAGLLLIWEILHARMTRNPITAGPAVVSGGVTDQTVAQRFQGTSSNVRVRDIVRGRVYGAVQVRYANGSSQRLILTGQTGYRAMVSRDSGPWAEEYMLQGCGNDLRMSGMRYVPSFGFRFVPEDVVEAVKTTAQPTPPVPTSTPAPAVEIPVPVATTPATVTETGDEGKKEFTFRPATESGRPNFIDSKGFESFEVVMMDGRTIIRFS